MREISLEGEVGLPALGRGCIQASVSRPATGPCGPADPVMSEMGSGRDATVSLWRALQIWEQSQTLFVNSWSPFEIPLIWLSLSSVTPVTVWVAPHTRLSSRGLLAQGYGQGLSQVLAGTDVSWRFLGALPTPLQRA